MVSRFGVVVALETVAKLMAPKQGSCRVWEAGSHRHLHDEVLLFARSYLRIPAEEKPLCMGMSGCITHPTQSRTR